MKKFSKLVVVALGIMLCFSMASCTKIISLDDIKASGKLIVATSPDFPPFEYMNGDKIDGWDVGVAENFAKDIGVKLELSNTPFDGILASVISNKAHIGMAGISWTEARAKSVDFTKTIFKSKQVIIVKTDSTIKTTADLAGKKVGGQKGTTGFGIAQGDNGEYIIGAPSEAKGYESGANAVMDLVNGKIDAVIIDTLPANKYVQNNAGKVKIVMDGEKELSIVDEDYAFIVKKGNKTLVAELNRLIDLYNTNGVFDAINAKYLI